MRFTRTDVDAASLSRELQHHRNLNNRPTLLHLHQEILRSKDASSVVSSLQQSTSSVLAPNPSSLSSGIHATPIRTSSPAHSSTQRTSASEIEQMLHHDAKGRQDLRWYGIHPDGVPPHVLAAILACDEVQQAWAAVLANDVAQERALETKVVGLFNAYASALRRLTGEESNWAAGRGAHDTLNASGDEESNRPDIIVSPSPGQVAWQDVLSVVEVKLDAFIDAREGVTRQVLRYARKLANYHPALGHAHVLTWCGPLLRLWVFDARSYCISPAYDMRLEAHRQQIGLVLWLYMAASERSSLLNQWQPTVGQTASLLHGGQWTEWTWETALKPTYVRPSLFGSRTAVFEATVSKGDGAVRSVFVKCAWMMPLLAGHETHMQDRLPPLPGVPRPLGQVGVDKASAVQRFTCSSQDGEHGLFLEVLVYEHRVGVEVPRSQLSEKDLASVFGQLAAELGEYAHVGLHYRDLNVGNVLLQTRADGSLVRSADGRPVLVLVDHGNMREGMRRRQGSGPAVLPDGGTGSWAASVMVRVSGGRSSVLEAVVMDDVRSANPLFLPHCMAQVQASFAAFQDLMNSVAKAQERLLIPGLSAPRRQDYERLVKEGLGKATAARRSMYVNAHRYIDDLESATWLLMYLVARSHGREAPLRSRMEPLAIKREHWTDPSRWAGVVDAAAPFGLSSEDLRGMLEGLNRLIWPAQELVRASLASHLAVHGDEVPDDLPAELDVPLQDVEASCFAAVQKLLCDFANSSPDSEL